MIEKLGIEDIKIRYCLTCKNDDAFFIIDRQNGKQYIFIPKREECEMNDIIDAGKVVYLVYLYNAKGEKVIQQVCKD